jgi:hypothetical protein
MRYLVLLVIAVLVVLGYRHVDERLGYWQGYLKSLKEEDSVVLTNPLWTLLEDAQMRSVMPFQSTPTNFDAKMRAAVDRHYEIQGQLRDLLLRKPYGIPLNFEEREMLAATEKILAEHGSSEQRNGNVPPAPPIRPRTPSPQEVSSDIARRYGGH